MKKKVSNRLIKLAAFLFIFMAVHHFVLRPWMLNWGAPEKIRQAALSADQFTGGISHTRAVLINAIPEKIWPWLVQLGQERGGFYSYAWLENIFFADMKNVYQIKPELQVPRAKGDTIWMANRKNYGGMGYQIIAEVVPEQSFIMVGGKDYNRILANQKAVGAWSIYLYPEDATSTWLIARSSGDEPVAVRTLRYFTFEVPHFIMEQKMLRTIKTLAEE